MFDALKNRKTTKIPVYDKSAFSGQGDRADASTWEEVNKPGEAPIEVVVFEGWCVGFRPLDDETLEAKWADAKKAAEGEEYQGQLARHRLEDLVFVNEALKGYNELTE